MVTAILHVDIVIIADIGEHLYQSVILRRPLGDAVQYPLMQTKQILGLGKHALNFIKSQFGFVGS